MKLDTKNVKFYKSLTLNSHEDYFDDRKEIVFVGRSNMGKSSLLNTIFNKKDLVKTSAKPGKTKMVNLFLVSNKYYFTDLPGYGFAKLGKEVKAELDGLISWYLEERKDSIQKVVMLIDSKNGAQESDIDMYKFILELELPVLIVLSKIDKLSKSEISRIVEKTKNDFFGQEILTFSSKNKTGLKEILKIFENNLK